MRQHQSKRSKDWLRETAAVLGAGAAVAALGVAVGARRWHAETDQLLRALSSTPPPPHRTVHLDSLNELPPAVRRYFGLVLREGQSFIRRATIRQEGEFRSKQSDVDTLGWEPFTATQVFATQPPAFVWDARIHMAPVGHVWVRDGYVAERASMLGAVLASIPVVHELDSPDLRAGALQRYLAEAVWLPTALLPESGVVWTRIDDSQARASLTDGPTTVSLEFGFGQDGLIASSYTPARKRADPAVKNRYTSLPWGGSYSGYREQSGMQVPTESEVYWIIGGKRQAYYRGRNTRIEYELEPRLEPSSPKQLRVQRDNDGTE